MSKNFTAITKTAVNNQPIITIPQSIIGVICMSCKNKLSNSLFWFKVKYLFLLNLKDVIFQRSGLFYPLQYKYCAKTNVTRIWKTIISNFCIQMCLRRKI